MAKATNTETKNTEEIRVSAPVQEEKVKIKLPRLGKNDTDVFVSVNEKTWLIKRGEEVEVPVCVAEVLRHQEELEEEAYRFDTAAQK